jgi:hypothetical protein
VTESSPRTTLIGPGRTPARSSGTDTADAAAGISVRTERHAMRTAVQRFAFIVGVV